MYEIIVSKNVPLNLSAFSLNRFWQRDETSSETHVCSHLTPGKKCGYSECYFANQRVDIVLWNYNGVKYNSSVVIQTFLIINSY